MNDYQSGSGGKGIRVAAAAANIARGAAYGGVYGAAAEAAKSFLPELIKLGVILLFVVVLFPLFAFVSLPNILFGFNSSTDQEIIEFTDSAQELTQIYDRATSRTPSILERLVNTILPGFRLPDGSAQYDSYSVTENLGNLNQYWLVAIGSTKYKQDLTAMDEAAVDDLIYGKGEWKYLIPLGLVAWYFAGMLLNSIRLGIQSVFGADSDQIKSIWVVNPFVNFAAVFTPTGLATIAVGALMFCLITKKGYHWFSGYKYTRDKRGFDILPNGTHGTSAFMGKEEQEKVLLTGPIQDLDGTILGKQKDDPDDDDKYAEYVTLKPGCGLTEHIMIYGATGSGKTRGFVKPFILQAMRRRESMVLVDVKGEIYEGMSQILRDDGYEVKMFNLLDKEHSDAWNCLSVIEQDKNLVQSIAEVIIKNTSNANERQDFWEKAELNLLMALMHYVATQTIPGTNQLLPIQQRSLGEIYRILSNESFADLEQRFEALPKGHPALPPYGIFKLANRQIWGNIAIGLGNRLSVFQNPLVDKITSYNEIDLTLPGQKPCAYFCCISAQDSSLEFLSSLFFSQLFSSLMEYGRRNGDHGRLPVRVNVCLEEFCNIGKLMDFKRVLEVCRGSNIFCQLVVQSIPQLKDRYPKTEWEELIGCTDVQICLGCNDVDTAKYISQKCGVTTIRVENNQMPIAPLFSPVYSTTRPYSQTKSNTQRPLMYLDEVLHMNNRECLVLLRGQNVLKLYKITPEEFPAFCRLKDVRVSSHTPRWRITEESERRHAPQPAQKPAPAADATPPQPPQAPPSPSATPSPPEVGIEREARREKRRPASEPQYSYGLLDSSLCGLEGDAEEDAGELAETAPYGALELMETMPEDIGGPPL